MDSHEVCVLLEEGLLCERAASNSLVCALREGLWFKRVLGGTDQTKHPQSRINKSRHIVHKVLYTLHFCERIALR